MPEVLVLTSLSVHAGSDQRKSNIKWVRDLKAFSSLRSREALNSVFFSPTITTQTQSLCNH